MSRRCHGCCCSLPTEETSGFCRIRKTAELEGDVSTVDNSLVFSPSCPIIIVNDAGLSLSLGYAALALPLSKTVYCFNAWHSLACSLSLSLSFPPSKMVTVASTLARSHSLPLIWFIVESALAPCTIDLGRPILGFRECRHAMAFGCTPKRTSERWKAGVLLRAGRWRRFSFRACKPARAAIIPPLPHP